MLPVSGAEQLNTSLAKEMRPNISQIGAYSRLVSCTPSNSKVSSTCAAPEEGGMNMFHRPVFFALAFSSSTIGMTFHRSPSRDCCS